MWAFTFLTDSIFKIMDEKILSKLQAQCAKREYCSKDIYAKALMATEGNEGAAAEIVAALVEEKYVDDLRYAGAFAREKATLTGWGPVKIRFELLGKGIDEDTIAQALASIDPEAASAKLESMLQSKYHTIAEEPDCKLRLLKFALSKGYNYNDIREVVGRITAKDN